MLDLGWGNDPEVEKIICELQEKGVKFEHTFYDRRGYDNIYTSTDKKYCYHLDSSD